MRYVMGFIWKPEMRLVIVKDKLEARSCSKTQLINKGNRMNGAGDGAGMTKARETHRESSR